MTRLDPITRRLEDEDEWLAQCRVNLMLEAIGRGITSEQRAESVLHADAVTRRLRGDRTRAPRAVRQPVYAALGLGSAAEAEGRN